MIFEEKHRDIKKYVIYDDVVTTGGSILQCIQRIGRNPEFCICIANRLKNNNFVTSLKAIMEIL
jgi:orotate phosphoribosyltransferase